MSFQFPCFFVFPIWITFDMIPSSQYLERNVKKVIGGCTVGKKGNRNPPRPQKHTNKSSDAIVLGFRCAFSRSSLDDDRTKLHPILFPPPTPITHPPSRFQFNFDTFKNSENNNQNKLGMGIIMFALFSDGKRKKSTRSFQRCGSHEAETMKLTCRRHVKK